MSEIVASKWNLFHCPIIVWINSAYQSSSEVYCLKSGVTMIMFILMVSDMISFKCKVPFDAKNCRC